MKDKIIDFFWDNILEPYFLFGINWILLVPLLFILIYFPLLIKYKDLTFHRTAKSKVFLIPSFSLFIICIALYLILPLLPVPNDRFIVAIAKFKPIPDDKAKEQIDPLIDRLIHNIKKQEQQYGIKVSVKQLRETIDCSSEEGENLAIKLGHQKGAHIIICGKVRLDEEFYLEPVIINLTKRTHTREITCKMTPLQLVKSLSDSVHLFYKKQKVNQITDLVTYIFGLIKYESGDYIQSIRIFNSMKENTTNSLFYLGSSLFYTNKINEALNAYNKGLEINPNHADLWRVKGHVLYSVGRYEDALTAFNRSLVITPDNADAWQVKGRTLYQLGRYEDALIATNRGLEMDSNNACAWNDKSIALAKLGKFGNAIDAINKALQIDTTDVGFLRNKCMFLINFGKYKEALTFIERTLSIYPEHTDLWKFKGDTLFHLGRYEDALTAFNRSLVINPDNTDAWLNKSITLSKLGKHEDARTAYQKARKLNP